MRANPGIRAADKQVPVARAKGAALEAGDYEWTLLVGGQQRRVNPDVGDDQRFQEWNTDLQRQVRLPGKASPASKALAGIEPLYKPLSVIRKRPSKRSSQLGPPSAGADGENLGEDSPTDSSADS